MSLGRLRRKEALIFLFSLGKMKKRGRRGFKKRGGDIGEWADLMGVSSGHINQSKREKEMIQVKQ